ncbi:MAG: 4Fe-4S dicluster domain-containing protein [Firmicutes bacterium]|nr:4Fe-4S dicluster domain-containing protein [Bacillota bacterium]
MSMSKDALTERILSLLPQVDCGGCPAKTCQACADEIVNSKDPCLCPAVNQKTVDKMARALEIQAPVISQLVAFLSCSGCAAGKERFSEFCDTCAEAVDSGFMRGECKDGCVGLCDCIKVCKFDAMSVVDGKVVIDREKCTGCGVCAEEFVCPQNLIRMIPAEATNFIPCSSTEGDEEKVRSICNYGCIGCGECEIVCPQDAVHLIDNHAVIDYEKCAGCDACTIRCRKKIIIDTYHDLKSLKETVAFVHCSEGKTAAALYEKMGVTSCEEAATLSQKELGLCTTGCCGLGSCAKVCRHGALSMVDGVAKVDPEKCVGCRDCHLACPKNLISMVPYSGQKRVECSSVKDYEEKLEVCSAACTGCGDCVANCPNGAIYMEFGHAVVDPLICEDCKMCQYVCARNVIKELEVPEFIFTQRDVLNVAKVEVFR